LDHTERGEGHGVPSRAGCIRSLPRSGRGVVGFFVLLQVLAFGAYLACLFLALPPATFHLIRNARGGALHCFFFSSNSVLLGIGWLFFSLLEFTPGGRKDARAGGVFAYCNVEYTVHIIDTSERRYLSLYYAHNLVLFDHSSGSRNGGICLDFAYASLFSGWSGPSELRDWAMPACTRSGQERTGVSHGRGTRYDVCASEMMSWHRSQPASPSIPFHARVLTHQRVWVPGPDIHQYHDVR